MPQEDLFGVRLLYAPGFHKQSLRREPGTFEQRSEDLSEGGKPSLCHVRVKDLPDLRIPTLYLLPDAASRGVNGGL